MWWYLVKKQFNTYQDKTFILKKSIVKKVLDTAKSLNITPDELVEKILLKFFKNRGKNGRVRKTKKV